MKKIILLTGGSGMVGSNIIKHNFSQNYKILSPTSSDLNLLNYKDLEDYIKFNKPELVIHAAGIVGGIKANINYPVKFLVDNMQMGLNILMASKTQKVKKFINFSSSCMYPKNARNPLLEDSILKGELESTNEGYALSKITSTRLCEYISREDSSFLYKTVIPCNLYGKYDDFSYENSHMIPGVIKKIHDAKNKNLEFVNIWGDGLARREFMYAADIADFIYYAVENFNKMPQNINVGLGLDYSIIEYYKIIADVIGYKGKFNHDMTKPTGMNRKLIDDKRLNEFGWSHQTSLETGIKETYKYFLDEVKK
ncbi:NAD-dependent epimerase/dehydratase family protein [Candidatus Pelagibacter communis]|jgi:GDP-L-fucose synthase|uniref:NAD-dependent epimerase/dehydratase family protein n=1 Tax=Pelagibacter ubique TaxID=198252 RepID=UPI00035E63CF|nr:NAD-dependent epimerase/dehydratase family protein [Candidatus Pelagibacter ubique]